MYLIAPDSLTGSAFFAFNAAHPLRKMSFVKSWVEHLLSEHNGQNPHRATLYLLTSDLLWLLLFVSLCCHIAYHAEDGTVKTSFLSRVYECATFSP